MNTNQLTIPVAIVAAGIFIAGAIFFKGNGLEKKAPPQDDQTNQKIVIEPVTEKDHILGNPNAPIKIVEYSDLECPVCKEFHPILHQLINEYGKKGEVAWVYRHLPIESLHSKAKNESLASECAFEQGGDISFFKYIDEIFKVSPANNKLDPAELIKIAERQKLDLTEFKSCMEKGERISFIEAQLQDAARALNGRLLTPWNIIITAKNTYEIKGYVPYANLKSFIEDIKKQEGLTK